MDDQHVDLTPEQKRLIINRIFDEMWRLTAAKAVTDSRRRRLTNRLKRLQKQKGGEGQELSKR